MISHTVGANSCWNQSISYITLSNINSTARNSATTFGCGDAEAQREVTHRLTRLIRDAEDRDIARVDRHVVAAIELQPHARRDIGRIDDLVGARAIKAQPLAIRPPAVDASLRVSPAASLAAIWASPGVRRDNPASITGVGAKAPATTGVTTTRRSAPGVSGAFSAQPRSCSAQAPYQAYLRPRLPE